MALNQRTKQQNRPFDKNTTFFVQPTVISRSNRDAAQPQAGRRRCCATGAGARRSRAGVVAAAAARPTAAAAAAAVAAAARHAEMPPPPEPPPPRRSRSSSAAAAQAPPLDRSAASQRRAGALRSSAAAACATVGRREHGCAIAGRTYGLLARAAGMAGLGRTAVSLGRVHEGLLLLHDQLQPVLSMPAGLFELGRRVLDRRSCRSSLRSQAAHAVIVGTQEALSTRFFRSQGRGRGWRRGSWPRSGVCACVSAMSEPG